MNKEYMIDVNSFVMNNYQGIIRYGTVTKKIIKADGWAYYEVEWYDDASYKESIAWRNSLNNKENEVTEYRGDTLIHIEDPKRIANCVNEHFHFLKAKITRLMNNKNEMKRVDVFSVSG